MIGNVSIGPMRVAEQRVLANVGPQTTAAVASISTDAAVREPRVRHMLTPLAVLIGTVVQAGGLNFWPIWIADVLGYVIGDSLRDRGFRELGAGWGEALAWAVCEQLIDGPRAARIERSIVRRLGSRSPCGQLRSPPSAERLAACEHGLEQVAVLFDPLQRLADRVGEVLGPVRAVHRVALEKHGGHDVVAGAGIRQQLLQQIAVARPVPQMVMRIDDRQLGLRRERRAAARRVRRATPARPAPRAAAGHIWGRKKQKKTAPA